MYARSPTATVGEPVLSTMEKPAARFDKQGDSKLHILQLEMCRNRDDRQSCVFRGEGLNTKLHVRTAENPISDLQFVEMPHSRLLPVLEDEFQNTSVWVTGTHVAGLDCSGPFSLFFAATMFKFVIPDGTKFYCQSIRYPRTIFWKACL